MQQTLGMLQNYCQVFWRNGEWQSREDLQVYVNTTHMKPAISNEPIGVSIAEEGTAAHFETNKQDNLHLQLCGALNQDLLVVNSQARPIPT